MYKQEYGIFNNMIEEELKGIVALQDQVEVLKVEVDKTLIARDTAILNNEDGKAKQLKEDAENLKEEVELMERRIKLISEGLQREKIHKQADKVVKLMLQEVEQDNKEAAELERKYEELREEMLVIAATKENFRSKISKRDQVIRNIGKQLPEYAEQSASIRTSGSYYELNVHSRMPEFEPITQNTLFHAQGGW